jgi:hypothetical protein
VAGTCSAVKEQTLHVEEAVVRRLRTTSMLSTAALAAGVLVASSAFASSDPLPPPADLQVVDLTSESVTITWDAVPEAEDYSVSINSSGTYCPGGGRSFVTAGLSATFADLTWDCSYVVAVRARDITGYPWRLSSYARVTFSTPLPEGYVFPGPPSNFRAELTADGKISSLEWDPATVGEPPLIYNVYAAFEPDVGLPGPFFRGLSETFVRDHPTEPYSGLDYLNGIIDSERPERVTLWVTTVDVIKYPVTKESVASNQVVLDCRSGANPWDVVCSPA